MKRLPFDKPKKKKVLNQYIYRLRKGRKKKKSKPKLRKIPAMKRQAWKLFSKYLRSSSANEHGIVKCYTCDSPHFWKDIQGGHFIHGHYKHTYLLEDNVRPQCVACNKWRNGNLMIYAERLLKELGREKIDAMRELSLQIFKPSREYYQEIIDRYKGLIDGMNQERRDRE